MSDKGREDLWSLSAPVGEIDAFLSHAWRTPGVTKYIQLLLRRGARASALMVSMPVAVLLVSTLSFFPPVGTYGTHILSWHGTGPLGIYCTVFGTPIMLLTIFAIPAFIGKGPVVFLDCACICQTNEILKKAGINALAAFLKHSRELHIMWSPEYFRRLWCVYELAVFLHPDRDAEARTGRQYTTYARVQTLRAWPSWRSERHAEPGRRRVCLHPVYMESALLTYMLIGWVGTVPAILWHVSNSEYENLRRVVGVGRSTQSVAFLPLMHVLRIMVRAKLALKKQIREFDVEAAGCSEEKDRDFIMGKIRRWFGDAEAFNQEVRMNIGRLLHRKRILHPGYFRYKIAVACVLSYKLGYKVDFARAYWQAGMPPLSWLAWTGRALAECLFLEPSFLKIFFHLAECSTRQGDVPWWHLRGFPTSFLAFLLWALPKVALDYALARLYREHLIWCASFLVASALLALACFSTNYLDNLAVRPAPSMSSPSTEGGERSEGGSEELQWSDTGSEGGSSSTSSSESEPIEADEAREDGLEGT